MKRLDRRFFARDSLAVAPDLLGKLFVVGACMGRIVEVEAYRQDDPASHSWRGITPRTAVMFGPAGHLYVYFTYGMHFCANVVTGQPGEGSAVLVRALVPLAGLDEMRARRGGARRDVDLANGPAKVCQAFGLDRSHDGLDLVASESLRIGDDGTPPPAVPGVPNRIGISVAVERPWRFFVSGDPHVSKGRPAGLAAT